MNFKFFQLLLVLFSISITSGCSLSPAKTQQELAQDQEFRMALIERMGSANPTKHQEVKKQAVELPKVGESELAQQIAEMNKSSKSSVIIERVRDGLKIDGQPYLDPEGEIIDFASNSLNGNIVYVIKVNNETRMFKYMNAGSNELPIVLGMAEEGGSNTAFKTVTGQKFSGDSVLPTSTGVLIARTASAFLYKPGSRAASIMVPEGYHVAPIQRGDAGSTKYVLLEKDPVEESSNPLGSMMSSLGALGSTLGVSEVDDYILYNFETKNQVTLDVSIEGKKVAEYSNCVKQNNLFNKCSSVDYYNSLYENGLPNSEHYYWRISWHSTPQGVFAVVGESSNRKINLIELNERKRATVLERMLGIAYFKIAQKPDGKISIDAQMGFSQEHLDDAVKKFNESNPVVLSSNE